MSKGAWVLLAVLLAGILFWTYQDRQQLEQSKRETEQFVCEVQHDRSCVYDNRFEEWVPR